MRQSRGSSSPCRFVLAEIILPSEIFFVVLHLQLGLTMREKLTSFEGQLIILCGEPTHDLGLWVLISCLQGWRMLADCCPDCAVIPADHPWDNEKLHQRDLQVDALYKGIGRLYQGIGRAGVAQCKAAERKLAALSSSHSNGYQRFRGFIQMSSTRSIHSTDPGKPV